MRRNNLQTMSPAELAIFNATQEVEKMPADVRLTNAVILLSKARDEVANFIDGVEPASPVSQPAVEEDWKEKFNGWLINNMHISKDTATHIIGYIARYFPPSYPVQIEAEGILKKHVKDIYLFTHGTLEKREQFERAVLLAMEEYAGYTHKSEGDAVAFGERLNKNGWEPTTDGWWYKDDNCEDDSYQTTKELYKIYKNG